MILLCDVVNQKIVRKDNNYIVADSKYYLQIDFNFTRDWDGCTKLATFRNGQTVVTVELEKNSCIVPWEVIKQPAFMFSLIGMRDDVTITSDVVKVLIKPSGDKEGCTPQPPTKEFYEDLKGGLEGQVLIKQSDADFDYVWIDLKDIPYDDSGETIDQKISKKQDVIQFIDIDSTGTQTHGVINQEDLQILNENRCNKLAYGGKVYYFSITERPLRKYFTTGSSNVKNEIDVNMITGEWIIYNSVDQVLQGHMNDAIAHISQSDRDFWNNKVTAVTEDIENANEDKILVLTKENII